MRERQASLHRHKLFETPFSCISSHGMAISGGNIFLKANLEFLSVPSYAASKYVRTFVSNSIHVTFSLCLMLYGILSIMKSQEINTF
jgi:hypothetical protein